MLKSGIKSGGKIWPIVFHSKYLDGNCFYDIRRNLADFLADLFPVLVVLDQFKS